MASISFYKDRTNWDSASTGAILFDTAKRQIFLKTGPNTDDEIGFGKVRDAEFIETNIVEGGGKNTSTDQKTRVLKIWKDGDTDNNPSINLDLSDLASAEKVDTLIRALQTELAAIPNTYYNKDQINSLLGSTFTYKGSVNTYADLPTEKNKVGDVWNIKSASMPPSEDRYGTTIKAGDNVVWGDADETVAAGWDVLSGVMSGLATSEQFDKLSAQVGELNTFANGKFVASITGTVKTGSDKPDLKITITTTPEKDSNEQNIKNKNTVAIELDTTVLEQTLSDIRAQIAEAAKSGVLTLGGAKGNIKVKNSVDPFEVLFTFVKNPDESYTMSGSVKLEKKGSASLPVFINDSGYPQTITPASDITVTPTNLIATDTYVTNKVTKLETTIMSYLTWKNWQ